MLIRVFCILLACLSMSSTFAQRNLRLIWMEMPDSLVEYLNATKRTEMVDFYNMGVKAETTNLLLTPSVLDSISDNYALVTLNECVKMQLALLKTSDGDSLVCMVKTFLGGAPESVVSFYNTKWQSRDASQLMAKVDASQLIARPDTMDVERYEQLAALVDPVLMAVEYDPGQETLLFSLSTPLLTQEEIKQVNAILLQRKLKWNGRMFN